MGMVKNSRLIVFWFSHKVAGCELIWANTLELLPFMAGMYVYTVIGTNYTLP